MLRFLVAALFIGCSSLAFAQTGDVSNPQTNASALTSGTLAAARGGAGATNGALKGNGAGTVSQAACADLSGVSASCATDATNAANIASGILPAGRLPALTGDTTTSVGTVTTTTTGINGVNMNSAWSTYVPTATCTAGTITTDTIAGRYRFIGTKTVMVWINVNISTLGTCTGTITVSVPPGGTVNGTGGNYIGSALNLSGVPAAVPMYATNGGGGILLVFAAAPAANNYFGMITYEVN